MRGRLQSGRSTQSELTCSTWSARAKSEADRAAGGRAVAWGSSFVFFSFFFGVVTRGTLVRVETPGSKHTSLQARSEHPRWIPITFLLTTGGETRAKHFCFPFEGTHDREISGEG